MKMIAIAALAALGCAPAPAPEPTPPPSEISLGGCDAAPLTNLVGRAYSETLAAEARRRSGARAIRRIRPGDAVTMDYLSDRLNIHLDGRDRIERFACG